MTLSMIARADDGGLGNLTWEVARHLRPDRIVLMHLGRGGRGEFHVDRYAEHSDVMIVHGVELPTEMMDYLLEADCVFTAETAYRRACDLWQHAEQRGVTSVLYAMPEFFRKRDKPTKLVVPTSWRIDQLPDATILPLPVAEDRFTPRRREQALTFLHVAAPAMLDRNGSKLLFDALQWVTEPINLLVRGPFPHRPVRAGNVTITHLDPVENYWDGYPDEADVLILPRRYAGLSMPMQEAAASGMAILSTDLSPQTDWLPDWTLIPPGRHSGVTMPCGRVNVYEPSPRALAAKINQLAREPELVRLASDLSLDWAHTHSWENLLPLWQQTLS